MKERIKRYFKKLFKILKKPEMSILPSNIAFNLILALIPLLTIVVLIASSFDISIAKVASLVESIIPKQVSDIIIEVISGKGFDNSVGIFNIAAFVIASNGTYAIITTSDALYKIQEKNEIKKKNKCNYNIINNNNTICFPISNTNIWRKHIRINE